MLSIKLFGWSSVCFGSIETSKLSVSVYSRSKTTETNRNKLKQTETNRNNPNFFLKNIKICSLSNCFGCSPVFFWFNRNSLFRYRTETNVLFRIVPKLVSVVLNRNQFRRTPWVYITCMPSGVNDKLYNYHCRCIARKLTFLDSLAFSCSKSAQSVHILVLPAAWDGLSADQLFMHP